MFNLKTNPHEFIFEHGKKRNNLTDLAEKSKFMEKRMEMEALLFNEMKRLNDPYRLWDQPKR